MMMHVEIEKYAGMTSACGLGAYRRPSDETFFVAFHVAAVSMSISQKKGTQQNAFFQRTSVRHLFFFTPFWGLGWGSVCRCLQHVFRKLHLGLGWGATLQTGAREAA
jgi:hypothetical protein